MRLLSGCKLFCFFSTALAALHPDSLHPDSCHGDQVCDLGFSQDFISDTHIYPNQIMGFIPYLSMAIIGEEEGPAVVSW